MLAQPSWCFWRETVAGYGYGIMGSTTMPSKIWPSEQLQNVKTWIPAFSDEVIPVLTQILHEMIRPLRRRSAHTRRGRIVGFIEKNHPTNKRPYDHHRLVIVDNVLKALRQNRFLQHDCAVYTALTLPLDLTDATKECYGNLINILIVEEHVNSIGGLAQQLSVKLLEAGIHPKKFKAAAAQGYPNGRYGSQAITEAQSGLDVARLYMPFTHFYHHAGDPVTIH